jgi:DNA-binding CsgD family transcriptional regulator
MGRGRAEHDEARIVDGFYDAALGFTSWLPLESALGHSWAEGLLFALDVISCPAFLLNGKMLIDRLNRAGEKLLGHGLELVQGRLCPESHRDELELDVLVRSAVHSATEADAPRIVIIIRAGRPPLLARVIPLRRECELWFGLLLVSEVGTKAQGIEELLRKHYGLTKSESAMTTWLAEGKHIEDFAEIKTIATGTARQLSKQALAKTGTHRQSELVALVKDLQAALGKLGERAP